MTGEIDITQLRRKKKKKEKKKKKRGYSDYIKTGKVRSKQAREKAANAPPTPRKKFTAEDKAEE
jgi:hypothetical protein